MRYYQSFFVVSYCNSQYFSINTFINKLIETAKVTNGKWQIFSGGDPKKSENLAFVIIKTDLLSSRNEILAGREIEKDFFPPTI